MCAGSESDQVATHCVEGVSYDVRPSSSVDRDKQLTEVVSFQLCRRWVRNQRLQVLSGTVHS